jgi:thermitase
VNRRWTAAPPGILAVCLALSSLAGSQPAPSIQFTRLALKLKPAGTLEAAGPPPPAVAERTVQSALGPEWKAASTPDPLTFYAEAPATRTEAAAPPPSVGSAWEQAYALRAQRDRVEYAEPLFQAPGQTADPTGPFDCRSSARLESFDPDQPDHIRGALDNPEWSLSERGANVRAAWALFGTRRPGEDIVVAHPDTGYRPHPEIWTGVSAASHIHPEDGWDFADRDPDPLDDLVAGVLKNPGHGTRTASVIVSPEGTQLSGSTRRMSGVAPAAYLIPLRVTRGVAMLEMGNLADAIAHASGSDRSVVKRKADVISISLGGAPSRRLRDAVRGARLNNVIVLAAAGNQVKTVVWPARYGDVIAVAASNYDSKPWKGSCRGKAVWITAPGETVWCASTRPAGGAATEDCLAVSNGTSFAVATTAGVAALWLSFHQGSPALEALRKANAIAWAFGDVLRRSFRPVNGWDTGRYGPGIVDAARVLQAPLPPAPDVPLQAPALSPCDADLEGLLTVFDEAPNPRRRVAALLRPAGDDPCAVSIVADEVAFLYGADDRVRTAIDRVAGRGEPGGRDLRRARDALRARDISPTLREVLGRS